MSAPYKLHYTPWIVLRTNADGSVSNIPTIATNSEYQEFLKWQAMGNTPDPADPAPSPSPNEASDNADIAAFPTRTQIANAIDQINTDLGTLAGAPTNAQVVAILSRALNRDLYEIKALKALVKRGSAT